MGLKPTESTAAGHEVSSARRARGLCVANVSKVTTGGVRKSGLRHELPTSTRSDVERYSSTASRTVTYAPSWTAEDESVLPPPSELAAPAWTEDEGWIDAERRIVSVLVHAPS